MRKDNGGAGLAAVLLILAVLGALALTLASSTTFHLRLATHQSLAAQSRNLSESVLALAVDRLADQRDFGAAPTSNSDTIVVQFSPSAPIGRLSFDSAQASLWGVPLSVNNLENDASVVLVDGRTLPPFSAYLAAKSDYGGGAKIVESVITIPKYKYALATSGKVVSNGRLLVASIDDDSDLSGGLAAIPLDKLKPGHLAALSTNQTVLDADSAANSTLITGDVVAGGSVSLGAYTKVEGSVLQNHEPEELPDLEVTDYDPAGWAGLQTVTTASMTAASLVSSVELTGMWRRQGDLDVYGKLDLDGGYLYVDGDLNITGGVIGKGSIFCTGDIRLGGANEFASDNVQALVAGGEISITGGSSASDRDSSFFSGILFSHRGMNLSNVTVVGSAINNSPDPDSTLELNNVGLLSNPKRLDFDFGLPGNTTKKIVPGADNAFAFYKYADDFAEYFDPAQDGFHPPDPDSLPLKVYYVGGMKDLQPEEYQLLGTSDDPAGIVSAMIEYMGSEGSFTAEQAQVAMAEYGEWLGTELTQLDELYQRSKQESLKRGKFSLDPNQFIPFEERVRVIWTRQVSSG